LHEHKKNIVEINIAKEQGRTLSVNFSNELKQRREKKKVLNSSRKQTE
jgi:hypothetical protein